MVVNDILVKIDSSSNVALVLLDLSSAFDRVGHLISVERLRQCVGIQGTDLSWFASYLQNRTFSVEIGNWSSSTASITCGVP